MGCPPVRGDNPRDLASGLSYVQVDKHGITILYHLHQCIGLWIVRLVAIRSDPRFMSDDSQIELRVTG